MVVDTNLTNAPNLEEEMIDFDVLASDRLALFSGSHCQSRITTPVPITHSCDSRDSWCNHLGTLIITDRY
jgi:ABC-type uncharacterized transport system ATPase subunit